MACSFVMCGFYYTSTKNIKLGFIPTQKSCNLFRPLYNLNQPAHIAAVFLGVNLNKHTPSPWFASNAYGNGSAIWIAPTEGAKMVLQGANCLRSDSVKYEEISIEQLQANAKLIVAAPDLYDALQSIVDNKTLPPELLIPARAALEKAAT